MRWQQWGLSRDAPPVAFISWEAKKGFIKPFSSYSGVKVTVITCWCRLWQRHDSLCVLNVHHSCAAGQAAKGDINIDHMRVGVLFCFTLFSHSGVSSAVSLTPPHTPPFPIPPTVNPPASWISLSALTDVPFLVQCYSGALTMNVPHQIRLSYRVDSPNSLLLLSVGFEWPTFLGQSTHFEWLLDTKSTCFEVGWKTKDKKIHPPAPLKFTNQHLLIIWNWSLIIKNK